MKRALLPILAVALLVFAPDAPGAESSLPTPANSAVVVPTSIAGIKLGMTEAEARAAWGDGGKCAGSDKHGSCEYGVFDRAAGSAFLEFAAHKVVSVAIFGGESAAGDQLPSAGPSLTRIKTSGGIGIGSKFEKLKAAFPKGRLSGSPSEKRFSYEIQGPGGSFFQFALLGPSQRVYSLVLGGGAPKHAL